MKHICLLVSLCLVTLVAISQTTPNIDTGKAVRSIDENDPSIVFTKTEIEAQFPGGMQTWSAYLKQNLRANTPIDNGARNGTYIVIIRFIVSKDGSIRDVAAETKHRYGMEEEAIRVITKGPHWLPALQNGRKVNAYRRQPITFVVQ